MDPKKLIILLVLRLKPSKLYLLKDAEALLQRELRRISISKKIVSAFNTMESDLRRFGELLKETHISSRDWFSILLTGLSQLISMEVPLCIIWAQI